MHPIKFVAKKTGLSAHVIRMWERRYGVVIPRRTDTNRRLYSDADIERLILLRRATQAGHNISALTKLPPEKLREISESVAPSLPAPAKRNGSLPIDECMRAVHQLDGKELERLLSQSAIHHTQTEVLERLVAPLMDRIGQEWSEGRLRPAQEHMASAVVRSFLASLISSGPAPEFSPRLVVTTPAGQWHEIGALMVTATAAAQGWQVTYLGANLPADEIAGAAVQGGANAVALSIVYPGDDPNVAHELRKLRKALPASVKLLAGGRCASRYQTVLQDIDASLVTDLADLRRQLTAIRA